MTSYIFLLFAMLFIITHGIKGAPMDVSNQTKSAVVDELFGSKCNFCDLMVKEIFMALEKNVSNEQIINALVSKCETFKIHNEEVCRGTMELAAPTIRYIYDNSKIIPGNVCGIMLQNENCTMSDPEKLEWSINPSSIPKPSLVDQSLLLPPKDSPTLKVLHIADPHWDPEYLEGSNANCGKPLCCQASSGDVKDAKDAAGYWGDYRSCDMPWRAVEQAIAHMANQHPDVAYIIWTGDLVPHNNWKTDKDENLMIHDRLMKLMKKYFPDTPLYPTLGNHESHPVNSFAPPEITDPEFSSAWLYNDADEQWAQWLPTEVSSTIRHGGYYTTLARPGLRIVSMNMNYCYIYNWWMLYKSQDPASGLLWLREILEKAEAAGEKVHILSHIPAGNDDCLSVFSREFAKIINRFESTVMAQFYGHTHNEEHKIFYDQEESDRPVNVAFIAGSLAPYINLNPSYKVYTVDGPRPGATWAVTDFTTWYYNLTDANLKGASEEPQWTELYQAKKEYGLDDLSPTSMDGLLQRMLEDNGLFNRYFRNYHKAADAVVPKGCDVKCQIKVLCPTVITNFADQQHCEKIKIGLLGRHQDL